MTWGAASDSGMGVKSAGGIPMPPVGRPLGKLNGEDFRAVIEKGLLQYSKYIFSVTFMHVVELLWFGCLYTSLSEYATNPHQLAHIMLLHNVSNHVFS